MQLTEEQYQKEVVEWASLHTDSVEDLEWAYDWTQRLIDKGADGDPYELLIMQERNKRIRALGVIMGAEFEDSIVEEVKPWMVLPKNPQHGP